jgi:hypothetical protein
MAAAATTGNGKTPLSSKLAAEGRHDPDFGANTVPYTPNEGMGAGEQPWPASSSSAGMGAHSGRQEDFGDAPPPSYEDAIAQDAPPVMAPRPMYVPPPAVEDHVLGGGGDEKKGWH